jgi:predicted DNA-binding transcriptional regulator YafY
MLPRPPRRIDTGAIETRLRERGIDAHRRTIQRDLVELAEVFPIVVDERAKPYGWRWSDDAAFGLHVSAPLRTGARPMEVTLRVRSSSLRLVLDRIGGRILQLWNDDDDPLLTRVLAVVEDTPVTRRMLLAYGDEVEVIEPIALRREIVERARRAAAVHER